MHCFVTIKAGVRAYNVSAAIDKILLHVLVNSYNLVYSLWMSNAALAERHSPPRTNGCSDAKANGAVKWSRLTIYTVFQKSDAKIQITITTAYLIRIKYPLSSFNYHFSDVNVANFNKINSTVSKQQLFQEWNSKTEVSNMEKSP